MITELLAAAPAPVHTKGLNWASLSLILGAISTMTVLLGLVIRVSARGIGHYVHNEVTTVTEVLDKKFSGLDQRTKIMITSGIAVLALGLVERVLRITERRRP
jgi:hypothetical protein